MWPNNEPTPWDYESDRKVKNMTVGLSKPDFLKALRELLLKHGVAAYTHIPEDILAEYILKCIDTVDQVNEEVHEFEHENV